MSLAWKPPVARAVRAANDNAGRRVVVQLAPLFSITSAELEVFGSFLGQPEAANDNGRLEVAL